jgi:DNA-binding MarR family transcriptional regulator
MSPARQEVASRLHSACVHLLRVVRQVDTESGLSPARLSALSVLVFGGPRTIGGLADAEGVRSPTISSLVNHLEADGLVVRRAGTGDQRQVTVEATEAAHTLMRRAQGRRVDELSALLDHLGASEVALLSRAAGLIERAVRDRLAETTGAGPAAPQQGPTTHPGGGG